MPDTSNDKRCAHVDEVSGEQCGAFHTKESVFCYVHSGNIDKLIEARQSKIRAAKALAEDLELNYHSLKTPEEVLCFLEKIANGVLSGVLKQDKASKLSEIAGQISRIIKENKPQAAGRGFLAVDMAADRSTRLIAGFDADGLDQFLLAGESVAVQMLEQMQRGGRLKIEKKKEHDVIEAEVSEIDGIPDLLDLPPDLMRHKWKGAYEPDEEKKKAYLWYTCQFCGARAKNVNKETCPVLEKMK